MPDCTITIYEALTVMTKYVCSRPNILDHIIALWSTRGMRKFFLLCNLRSNSPKLWNSTNLWLNFGCNNRSVKLNGIVS